MAQYDPVNFLPFIPPIHPKPGRQIAPQKRRVMDRMGNGREGVWTGTLFAPLMANMTPNDLFVSRMVPQTWPTPFRCDRFIINAANANAVGRPRRTMLIVTAGICRRPQGQPRGSFAFVYNHDGVTVPVAHPVEACAGISGTEPRGHTSQRAKIRAVIAALRAYPWYAEGWMRVVIMADALWLVAAATGGLRGWARRGDLGANADLRRRLSNALGEYARWGCEVSFWHTDYNGSAMLAADRANVRRPRARFQNFRTPDYQHVRELVRQQ